MARDLTLRTRIYKELAPRMPISKTLVLASALTLTLQFLIFAYLYSSHRVRFFRYLLLAWGLMSLAKLLHAGQILVPDLEILGALINTAFVGATLLVLAGGLAFRFDYQIRRRDLLIGALAALGALGLGDLSDASVAARSLAGFATGGILILAGVQFWPRAAQPRYRGACFLATTLALWGVHRMVSPAFPAEPGTPPHLMMHLGFLLFYFLSTFAIIIMVLDRARSETATLKEFNERLVDGLGEAPARRRRLPDPPRQPWMHASSARWRGAAARSSPPTRCRAPVPSRAPARDRRRGADRGRGSRRPSSR